MTRNNIIALIMLTLPLAACSEEKQADLPPRPVLSMVAKSRIQKTHGFTGTVEAKFSADIGFQVFGRIISRDVQVGDVVRKGQELARLDATELELAVSKAEADLGSSLAKLDLAKLNEQRQAKLLETNASTREQLEEAVQGREAAEAFVKQLRAGLSKAQEQLGYATLRAETDGVVSAISGEAGQVVAAGQPVVTIARLEARDAVVDIPDGFSEISGQGARFDVALQANPELKARGVVREAAPQADAATRTRRIRIELDNPPPTFRLGSMVTATPSVSDDLSVWLPQSAIGGEKGAEFVWVIDPKNSSVSRRPVKVRPSPGGGLDVLDGVREGERIVTAGVNTLEQAQTIRFTDEKAL